MKQPDRFEKMVERVRWSDPDIPIMMAMLLRRQHAAYVRMVKKMPCIYADASGICGSHWQRSCKLSRGQLLDAFARYKKGTR